MFSMELRTLNFPVAELVEAPRVVPSTGSGTVHKVLEYAVAELVEAPNFAFDRLRHR